MKLRDTSIRTRKSPLIVRAFLRVRGEGQGEGRPLALDQNTRWPSANRTCVRPALKNAWPAPHALLPLTLTLSPLQRATGRGNDAAAGNLRHRPIGNLP